MQELSLKNKRVFRRRIVSNLNYLHVSQKNMAWSQEPSIAFISVYKQPMCHAKFTQFYLRTITFTELYNVHCCAWQISRCHSNPNAFSPIDLYLPIHLWHETQIKAHTHKRMGNDYFKTYETHRDNILTLWWDVNLPHNSADAIKSITAPWHVTELRILLWKKNSFEGEAYQEIADIGCLVFSKAARCH